MCQHGSQEPTIQMNPAAKSVYKAIFYIVPFNEMVAHYLSLKPSASGAKPEHATPWQKINRITYETPL